MRIVVLEHIAYPFANESHGGFGHSNYCELHYVGHLACDPKHLFTKAVLGNEDELNCLYTPLTYEPRRVYTIRVLILLVTFADLGDFIVVLMLESHQIVSKNHA